MRPWHKINVKPGKLIARLCEYIKNPNELYIHVREIVNILGKFNPTGCEIIFFWIRAYTEIRGSERVNELAR